MRKILRTHTLRSILLHTLMVLPARYIFGAISRIEQLGNHVADRKISSYVAGLGSSVFSILLVLSPFMVMISGSVAPVEAASWYNSSWDHRKEITIDNTKVSGSTAHTDIPILVDIASDSDISAGALSNGDDILFTSSNGTTKLDHEIESYSSGSLRAWVKVPSLATGTDTTLYIYYGNSGASNQENVSGVWSNNYAGVWHLEETVTDEGSATGVYQDSTSNANDGDQNGANEVSGQIGNGQDFDGVDDNVEVADDASLKPSGSVTLEAWLNWDATGSPNYAKAAGKSIIADGAAPWNSFSLSRNNNNQDFRMEVSINSTNQSTTSSAAANIPNNTWTHLTGTWESGDYIRFFVNGSQATTSSTTFSGSIYYEASPFTIGSIDTKEHIDGIVDEVRLSTVERSADWIATQYENTNSPSTFLSLAAEEDAPSASSSGINQTLSFQGKIVDKTDGTNIAPACMIAGAGNDTCDFRASIFADSSGGTALWSEIITDVELSEYNGVFGLNIGDYCIVNQGGTWTVDGDSAGTRCTISGGGVDWLADDSLYLQIEFDETNTSGENSFTSPETFTRKLLTSVPFALAAATVDGLGSGDLVQLQPSSAQSATGSSSVIWIDETGASAPNLLELEVDGSDAFVVGNNGAITSEVNSSGAAVTVDQTGSGDLLDLQSSNTTVLAVNNDGGIEFDNDATNVLDTTAGAGSATDDLYWGDQKVCIQDGTGCPENLIIDMVYNDTGAGSLSQGDLVVIDTSADNTFSTSNQLYTQKTLGVMVDASCADAATCKVQIAGVVDVNADGSVSRGQYLYTSTTHGQATGLTNNTEEGMIGIALSNTSGGTARMVIRPSEGGDIIQQSSGELSIGTAEDPVDLTVYGDLVIGGNTEVIQGVTNPVAMEVYDASDEGWRGTNAVTAASWYTETIDNEYADCVIGTNDRCGSQPFPLVVSVIATTTQVHLFDSNKNAPWMSFNIGSGKAVEGTVNAVSADNGSVFVATTTGVYEFDFRADAIRRYDAGGRTVSNQNIAGRNGTNTFGSNDVDYALSATSSNDVDAQVVEGDLMIAVATEGGATTLNLSQPPVYSLDLTGDGVASASSVYSSYSADRAFDNDDQTDWLGLTSALPVTLEYDFGLNNDRVVEAITLSAAYTGANRGPSNFTIEGSADGTFTDNGGGPYVLDTITGESWLNGEQKEFQFSNSSAYRYYRINISANDGSANYVGVGEMELQDKHAGQFFYEYDLNDDINNIALGKDGLLAFSNESTEDFSISTEQSRGELGYFYSGEYTTNYVYEAFDGNPSTPWRVNSSSGHIGAELHDRYTLDRYRVYCDSAATECPRDWQLQGSNNGGGSWTNVGSSQSGVTWVASEWKSFSVGNTTPYQAYRLNITASSSGSFVRLGELEMYPDLTGEINVFDSVHDQVAEYYSPNEVVGTQSEHSLLALPGEDADQAFELFGRRLLFGSPRGLDVLEFGTGGVLVDSEVYTNRVFGKLDFFLSMDDAAGVASSDEVPSIKSDGGSVRGNPDVVTGPNGIGEALDFDNANSDAIVYADNVTPAPGGQFSMGGWIKIDSGDTTAHRSIFGTLDSSGWVLALTSSNQLEYYDGTAWRVLGYSLPVDEWVHVAVIFDDSQSNLQLYVDGDLQSGVTSTALSTAPDGDALVIGDLGPSWPLSSTNNFDGAMADLFITMGTVLSERDIKSLMDLRVDGALLGTGAAGSTASTLQVSGLQNNKYQGSSVQVFPAGNTQVRSVLGNTDDTVTIAPNWSSNPTNGSLYRMTKGYLPHHTDGVTGVLDTSDVRTAALDGDTLYIGLNDGSNGGGLLRVDRSEGVIGAPVSDVYTDTAGKVDDYGNSWVDNFDDVIDIGYARGKLHVVSDSHYWVESDDESLEDRLADNSQIPLRAVDATGSTLTDYVIRSGWGSVYYNYTKDFDYGITFESVPHVVAASIGRYGSASAADTPSSPTDCNLEDTTFLKVTSVTESKFTAATALTSTTACLSWIAIGPYSTSSTGADLAENYLTYDLATEAGDVVAIDVDSDVSVQRTTGRMDTNAIGIVATQPMITLGPDDGTTPGVETTITGEEVGSGEAKTVEIALAGRVPVKVTLENGPIQRGDFLTPASRPGYAMKATDPGVTIGRAMTPFDGSSTVQGLVDQDVDINEDTLQEYADTVGIVTKDLGSTASAEGQVMVFVQTGYYWGQLDNGADVVADIPPVVEDPDTNLLGELDRDGKLSVDPVELDEDTSAGLEIAKAYPQAGELIGSYNLGDLLLGEGDSSISSIGQPLRFQTESDTDIDFFNGSFRFGADGRLVAKEIATDRLSITSNRIGDAVIKTGEQGVDIQVSNLNEDDKILLTNTSATDRTLFVKSLDIEQARMRVEVAGDEPATEHINFTYLVVRKDEDVAAGSL